MDVSVERAAGRSAQLIISPASGSDTSALGAELLDANGWTSTNWTGSWAAGWTHTAGNVSALSRAISGIGASQKYQVSVIIASRTAGSISVAIGGVTIDPVNGSAAALLANGTYLLGALTTGAGDLTITPTSTFDGKVTLSVKLVTPIASDDISIKDGDGAASVKISHPTASTNSQFMGLSSGDSSTVNAVQNTGFGYRALRNNVSGSANVAVGYNTMDANVGGTYCTGVGSGALRGNTYGWYNTAIGCDTLVANTTGYDNTAVGVDALYANTTGFNNTAVGFVSMIANTTGSNNTAFGQGALGANLTSNSNTAIGALALRLNTGASNTGVGVSALSNNVSGTGLVAVGNQAGVSNTASNNTYVGNIAGFSNSTGAGNTYVGAEAGYTAGNSNVSGSNNTYLGYQAGPSTSTQLSNCIAIGLQSRTSKSNQAVIGNTSNVELLTYGVHQAGTAYTVATLPTATAGARAYVTDATAPTYLGALTGGGAVVCPVFHNGSAWVSG